MVSQSGKPADADLTIYSRKGCHLCDEMKFVVSRRVAKHQLTLAELDIDRLPDLQEQHGARVPVLMAGNTEICWGRLDDEKLDNWLVRHIGKQVQE